jgi:hypothetical protein
MISFEQYKEACEQREKSDEIMYQYLKEQQTSFDERMKSNPIFKDEELHYSATVRCPCGHGLAYPKDCGPKHYWDCSAILKGIADKNVKHTDQLPFIFYDIKGEHEYRGTTRPIASKGSAG